MKSSLKKQTQTFRQTGNHWIWFTGSALVICIVMIFTVVGIIFVNGADSFWPKEVVLYKMKEGKNYLAILREEQKVPPAQAKEQNLEADPYRRLIMVANRDLYGQDFIWINNLETISTSQPWDVWVMERHEYGNFIGYLKYLEIDGKRIEDKDASAQLPAAIQNAQSIVRRIYALERYEIGRVNARLEKNRLAKVKVERELKGADLDRETKRIDEETKADQNIYQSLLASVSELRKQTNRYKVGLVDVNGTEKEMSLFGILEAWQPNQMGFWDRVHFYSKHLKNFLFENPREANTEGGVFPAIFGTVLMVILMSIVTVPFGVLTAFYLSEYAQQGRMVQFVRIALNNLAGVPSIVYGMFGLGFFVYFLGGNIDRIFYPEALPNPTWGTGGILWASLTLALLTVPVVVMATEESISSVPRGMREGSLALGASKFQTIKNILLPASLPGILTGVILAMARGAGEVAPLMITGVVKLAPSLCVDSIWPYLHLERKFMHLGFHIYDVGFQSPNIEASRPMVFTTALLLLFLVTALNLVAIIVRNRVRRKYTTGAFN